MVDTRSAATRGTDSAETGTVEARGPNTPPTDRSRRGSPASDEEFDEEELAVLEAEKERLEKKLRMKRVREEVTALRAEVVGETPALTLRGGADADTA